MNNLKIETKRDNQFEIEVKQIELLLQDTLNKLEFALKIPEILRNKCQKFEEALSRTEVTLIKRTFSSYLSKPEEYQESMHLKGEGFQEMQNLKNLSIKQLEDFCNSYKGYVLAHDKTIYDISTALQICNENAKIKELSSNCNIASSGTLNILRNFKDLFCLFIEKMKPTPIDEIRQERFLRKLYIQHKELFDNEFLKEAQDSEEEIVLIKSIERKHTEWENELEEMKAECQEYIQKLKKETDNRMASDWLRSEQIQVALSEQVDIEVREFENMRQGFVEEERKIRETKNHIEEELLAILEQYNRTMVQKYKVYESKKEIFEREKEHLNGLQEKYDKQTTEYETLMKEKREYEDKMIEIKMFELRRKLAARRIQRFYRKFRHLILIHGRRDGQKSKQRKRKTKI